MMPARFVLWLMLFLGLALLNMLFFNMHIALTDIVDEINVRHDLIYISEDYPNETTFPWNEGQQKLILVVSYCSIPLGNVMSALASPILGAKLLFGYSILVMSCINMITPLLATYENFEPLLITRVLIGLLFGVAFPSLFAIAPYWVPKKERGRFFSCLAGSTFGDFVLFGFGAILLNYEGWKMVFYVPAALGLAWTLVWIQLMFNRPEQHPRISDEEKRYIIDATNTDNMTTDRSRKSIPFEKIVLSIDVWVNILAQFGCMWTWFTLVMFGPLATFLEYIHEEDISKISLPIALPFFFRFMVMMVGGSVTDFLINKQWIRVKHLRKCFVFLANIVPAFAFIAQAIFGDNIPFQVLMIVFVKVVTGLNLYGTIVGLLDISPHFAGPIQGLACAIYALGGFLMPCLARPLTTGDETYEPWRNLYILGSFIGLGSGILFISFWDSEEPKEWDRGGLINEEIELRELGDNNRTRAVENYYEILPRAPPRRCDTPRPEDNFLAVNVTVDDNHFRMEPLAVNE